MARPLRLEFTGALYHITSRGDAREDIDYISLYRDRDQAIAAAYASSGYTLKAIGDHFGLHYARISRIVRAAEEVKRKT